MSNRLGDKLPRVTSPIPRDVRNYLDRIRDVMNGSSGELITKTSLRGLGVLDNNDNVLAGQATQDNSVGIPPVVNNLSASGAFQNIILGWDTPVYYGHAYTEVWASAIFDSSLEQVEINVFNNLDTASPIAITSGGAYNDYVGGGKGRFYWARSVNINDTAGPFNAVGGTYGNTAPDVELLLDTLQDSIAEGQLATALASRINLIDGDATLTNSVNNRIASEASARTAAITASANALQSQITDIIGADDYDNATAYTIGSLVIYQDTLYRATAATTGNLPTDTNYWDELGDYTGLGELVSQNSADIVAINDVSATSTSASAQALKGLQTIVTDPTTGLEATRSTLLTNYYTSAATDTAISNATTALLSTTSLDNYTTTATLTTDYYTKTQADNAISTANTTLLATTELDNYTTTAVLATDYYTKTDADEAIATSTETLQSQLLDYEVFKLYEFETDVEGFATIGATLEQSGGVLTLTSTSSDPMLTKTVEIDGSRWNKVRVRIRRIAGTGWQGMMYYTTSEHTYSASYRKDIADTTSDAFSILEFDMHELTAGGDDWKNNTITSIRFDFGNTSEDIFEIEYVAITALTPKSGLVALQTEAETRATETGELFAQYTVKIDNNGAVAGYGLASESNEAGGATTSFAVNADRFYIYPDTDYSQEATPPTPSAGQVWYKESEATYYIYNAEDEWDAFVPESPFIVQTTPTVINGVDVPVGVYIPDAFIANGSITTAKIGNAAIDTAQIAEAAITEAQILDGEITNAKIGNVIQATATTSYGQPNWKIDKTGSIIARNIEIRDSEDNLLLSSGSEVTSGILAPEVLYAEDWDYATTAEIPWTNYTGEGEQSLVTGVGEYEGKVLRIGNNSGNDQQWLIGDTSFYYKPQKKYRVKARLRQTAGSGTAYIGVAGRDSTDDNWVNATGLDTTSSQHYVAASAIDLRDTWTEVVGYFSGHGSPAVYSPEFDDPSPLHPDVAYFRPLVLVNYSGAAGTTEIDYIRIEEVEQDPIVFATNVARAFHVGGFGDIKLTPNASETGVANIGEINLVGSVFYHPNGTEYSITPDRGIYTPFELTSGSGVIIQETFFVIFSATNVNDRFTTLPMDDFPFYAHNFFIAIYDEYYNKWFAIDNVNNREEFVPVSSDCIVAYGKKHTTTGGLDSFTSTLGIGGAFATLDQITDTNITTYIEGAAIDTAQIKNAAIETALIDDLAVSNAKIANLAVNDAKIANLAVTNAKIDDLAVTTGKIQDLAVNTLQIAGEAVTVPIATYTSTDINLNNNTTIQQATIIVDAVSASSSILITLNTIIRGLGVDGDTSKTSISLYRGTTLLRTFTEVVRLGYNQRSTVTLMYKDTPGVGTHTYYFKATSPAEVRTNDRTVTLLQVKK